MTRGEGRRFAELAGACALAIGQPLLDIFGRSTETFVFRGVDARGYVLFAVAVVLVPPTVLWLGGRLVGRFAPGGRDRVHIATMGFLVAIAALVAVRWITGVEGGAAVALAVAAGALMVLAATRHPSVLRFFGYLAVLPAVAVFSFLVSAPASALLRGGGTHPAGDSSASDSSTDSPVVMLVLDEFPTVSLLDAEGSIDRTRFPNFARLADDSAWYRNYTTLNASTARAVPTILTGTIPERGREPLWSDWPDNLFTLLGDSHQLRVRETVTQLCPRSLCGGSAELTRTQSTDSSGLLGLAEDSLNVLSQLFDPRSEPNIALDAFEEELVSLDPVQPATDGDRRAGVQPARFAAFIDDLVEADEPVLHFLHLILPHGPWRFTHDGTEYESPEIDPPGQIGGIWTDEWPAALTEFRLELQARYTDILIGHVIDQLQATGLWDRATIVIVADHGGSFISGDRGRALTADNAFEVMWTPLFVRSPGLAPGQTDVNAQAIDVLPTIADLIGVAPPFETDGRSLVSGDGEVFGPSNGAGGDSGIKQYARFNNPFQPEDDAVIDIDADRELARVVAGGRAVSAAEVDDPVGSFLRATPHGELYGQPVSALEIGDPSTITLDIDQRARLENGYGEDPPPVYLGGSSDGDLRESGDDPWFVIVLDGEVAALSPVFPGPGRDQSVATLIDPRRLDPSGSDLSAFLVTTPGGPLHPVALS